MHQLVCEVTDLQGHCSDLPSSLDRWQKKWIYVQANPNTPIKVAFLNKLVKVIPQEALVNESTP